MPRGNVGTEEGTGHWGLEEAARGPWPERGWRVVVVVVAVVAVAAAATEW